MVIGQHTAWNVDGDLDQFGPVAVTDAGGELTFEPAPNATDPNGIINDVIGPRLANGDRRETNHAATSRVQPPGCVSLDEGINHLSSEIWARMSVIRRHRAAQDSSWR